MDNLPNSGRGILSLIIEIEVDPGALVQPGILIVRAVVIPTARVEHVLAVDGQGAVFRHILCQNLEQVFQLHFLAHLNREALNGDVSALPAETEFRVIRRLHRNR